MATQNGVGTVTAKGQAILAYINSIVAPATIPALNFKQFVLSSKPERVQDIVDDSFPSWNGKTILELEAYLTGKIEHEGNVSPGVIDSGTPNTLPLLLSTPISTITTDALIHTIFITVEDPAIPGSEYVFYSGCLYFDDNGTTGVYTDDGDTIPFTYIAGTNLLLRVNMQYTSGFPEKLEFVDTQAIEIEAHDQTPSAHNLTHLRIDGNNAPLVDIDWDAKKITNIGAATDDEDVAQWNQIVSHSATDTIDVDNLTDFDAAISALPKIVNNQVNINIATDHSSFSGANLNIFTIGGDGLLNITWTAATQTNIVKRIACVYCTVKIYISDFDVTASVDGAIVAVGSRVNIYDCELADATGTNKAAITATQKSHVVCSGVVISSGNERAVYAEEGSTVICGNMLHKTSSDYCTIVAFEATSGATIIKPNDFTTDVSLLIKTNDGRYSNTVDGGRIYGYFGDGDNNDDDGAATNNQLVVDVDNTNGNSVNQILRQAGPFIPENCLVTIRYANGTGGEYTDTDGLRINGWRGNGTLKFLPLSGTGGSVVMTHVASLSTDYAIDCRDNDINIVMSSWLYTLTTAGSHFLYFKNNTKKISIFDAEFRATVTDQIPIAYFEDCPAVDLEDIYLNFIASSTDPLDINLHAKGNTNIRLIDSVELIGGHTGLYVEHGARIHDIKDTSDTLKLAGASDHYSLYSITGGEITVSDTYSVDLAGALTMYTKDGGTIKGGVQMHMDNKSVTFT